RPRDVEGWGGDLAGEVGGRGGGPPPPRQRAGARGRDGGGPRGGAGGGPPPRARRGRPAPHAPAAPAGERAGARWGGRRRGAGRRELAGLPARHRGPVVLCELEGLSRPEAARRLGIPEGTLSSRLARAKARLRDRLASRGVSLPAAALSALLVREARAATVPLSLLESTAQAATLVAAGPSCVAAAGVLSASADSLSEGVIKAMFVAKLKSFALAAGTMTAVVSGAVVLAQPGPEYPQRGPSPPKTKVEVAPEQGQRAAALERKLDRVLEVLERLAGPGGPRLAENPGGFVPPRPENLSPPAWTTTTPSAWAGRPVPGTPAPGG